MLVWYRGLDGSRRPAVIVKGEGRKWDLHVFEATHRNVLASPAHEGNTFSFPGLEGMLARQAEEKAEADRLAEEARLAAEKAEADRLAEEKEKNLPVDVTVVQGPDQIGDGVQLPPVDGSDAAPPIQVAPAPVAASTTKKKGRRG